MGQSFKNGWLDDTGRVYIYYSLDDIQTTMCCAHQKACKLLGMFSGLAYCADCGSLH